MIPLVAQNIDTIEFKLNASNKRYLLPNDSRLIGKKITTLESYFSIPEADSELYAPSGREIIPLSYLSSCYLTLVSQSGKTIINNMPLSAFAFNTVYKPCINDYIDLTKSYISVMQNLDSIADNSLLVSFFYDSEECICFKEPNCCERVSITIDPNITKSFPIGIVQKLADKKIRRIEAVSVDKGTLLNLVTKNNLIFRDIPLYRFGYFALGVTIMNKMYINDFDINFERSFIKNINTDTSNKTNPIVLNFYYYES